MSEYLKLKFKLYLIKLEGSVTLHKSNKSKTGLEENLIAFRDSIAQTVALHLKGVDPQTISERIAIEIGQVNGIIRAYEEK